MIFHPEAQSRLFCPSCLSHVSPFPEARFQKSCNSHKLRPDFSGALCLIFNCRDRACLLGQRKSSFPALFFSALSSATSFFACIGREKYSATASLNVAVFSDVAPHALQAETARSQ